MKWRKEVNYINPGGERVKKYFAWWPVKVEWRENTELGHNEIKEWRWLVVVKVKQVKGITKWYNHKFIDDEKK